MIWYNLLSAFEYKEYLQDKRYYIQFDDMNRYHDFIRFPNITKKHKVIIKNDRI